MSIDTSSIGDQTGRGGLGVGHRRGGPGGTNSGLTREERVQRSMEVSQHFQTYIKYTMIFNTKVCSLIYDSFVVYLRTV